MKIATVQLNLIIGDIKTTIEKAINCIKAANNEGADLCVLTELITTGYPPKDLLFRDDLIKLNYEAKKAIIDATIDLQIAVVFGYVEKTNKDGAKPYFNAACVAQFGKELGRRYKTLLPTYDVFNEDRYFEPGNIAEEFNPIEIVLRNNKTLKLGVIICEEAWNGPEWPNHLYEVDPVQKTVEKGAEYLAIINASPYRKGVLKQRHNLVIKHAKTHRKGIVYVNQTGYNDNVGFDGNSFAVNHNGEIIFHAPIFQEDFSLFNTGDAPLEYPNWEMEWQQEMLLALTNGVKDYFDKLNIKGPAIIGLSGGIDSALVAYIAVQALGTDRVVGIGMPSEFSSDGSVSDAQLIAKTLGIKFAVQPIKLQHNAMRDAVNNINTNLFSVYSKDVDSLFARPYVDCKDSGVTDENLQARIRGMYLMALSNYYNGIVLSTGNKSELSVGYCTLYGDMCGGLAVISDVWKTEVYDLCNWINNLYKQEIIPWNTIKKLPSAELRANQHDQQSLPPYYLLDAVLQLYQEKYVSPDKIKAEYLIPDKITKYFAQENRNLEDDINKILKLVIVSEFKRNQSPTGLKVSPKLYKDGWQMPIVHALK